MEYSQAATNSDHPETLKELRPGEDIIFKLPFDRQSAAKGIGTHGAVEGELSVSVGFWSIETDKEGEYSNGLPLSVKAENSLKWTPPSN